ncbi:hypothetical protein I3F86_002215 [Salmonella enterica]|uniref:hypothetical protein n=1 Tax=Salmonella enterica TaxID=28901 RepID=UPI0009ACA1E3|nr:hypothetical protein [Salmonella enterica]ECB7874628.1 hypothetical protein [Salmonella enterica subsp. enterica serovar Stanley]EDQ7955138.1 hypothetical protein [Salmonella enterica subsp. enterica serovar Oslo]EGS9941593.1 hypothetical protein [Salmonella enterica]EHG2547246.1 hypothetical protein [Salmonella enterica]
MRILKLLNLFAMIMMVDSAALASTVNQVVKDDNLSVSGFSFKGENAIRAKEIYGSCYRLEEPIFISLQSAGNGVAGRKSWVSKVRFTLAQSKVINPVTRGHMRAKDSPLGMTWVDGMYNLGVRTSWVSLVPSKAAILQQWGWEVETLAVNNNTTRAEVYIPTRNLQTLEFVFASEANTNSVHFMFERQPGTNYMKNTGVWYPDGGSSHNNNEVDVRNVLKWTGNNTPYTGFNLVRTERLSFQGKQEMYDPVYILMGAYEVDFQVEPDTQKYGVTAAQFDAACK